MGRFIGDIYQAELEKVALANYVERRENQIKGVRWWNWIDYKNESLENGLNDMVRTAREMRQRGEL